MRIYDSGESKSYDIQNASMKNLSLWNFQKIKKNFPEFSGFSKKFSGPYEKLKKNFL